MHEFSDRTGITVNSITFEQLSQAYILLDYHKDEFCKMVKAVGIDSFLKKSDRFSRLEQAERELIAKENYIKAKNRLLDLYDEESKLKSTIETYEKNQKKAY